jgi:PAS domain S-box-containing protein
MSPRKVSQNPQPNAAIHDADTTLEEQLALMETLFHNAPVGFAFVDREFRYLRINSALATMHSWPLGKQIGKTVQEVVPQLWPSLEPLYRRALAGETILNQNISGLISAEERQDRHWLVSYYPVRLEEEVIGIGVIVNDISEWKQTEQLESEVRFRAIFMGSAVGMALVDTNGYPLVSNPALQEMLGYSQRELREMAFTQFTHPDDVALDWRLYGELREGLRDSYQIEKRYIRKDGSVIWGRLTVSLLRDAGEDAILGIGMVENITERKIAEQNLQDSLQRLKTLTSHLESVREEERTRVAREIHDDLGQALTGLKIQMASLRRQVEQQKQACSPEDLLEKIHAMNGQMEQTIKSVRRIATALRPAILDTLGLIPALEWQTREFQQRTNIKCRFFTNLDTLSLDPERTTAVFRIVQESLTNVFRHAKATRVKVQLVQQEDTLILTVQDNGVGIQATQPEAPPSFGLLGMRERAQLLDGDLQILSKPQKGTTIRLQLPILPPPHA